MLILPDTNRFRIDFYQFRQRILQTSGNRCGTSLSHIKIRKLFRCQLAGRIDGSSCLIGDHILYMLRNFFQKFHDNLLGFSRCRSISNGKQGNAVFFNQFFQGIFCSLDFRLCRRCSRINHTGIEHFSCLVHNCQLASGSKSRIPSKYHLPANWRLHQKLLQVLSKNFDGSVFCLFCQVASNLALNGRRNQAMIAIFHHFFEHSLCDGILACNDLFLQITKNLFLRSRNFHSQNLLFFSTV